MENDFVPFKKAGFVFEALSLPNLSFTFDVGHAIIAEVMEEEKVEEKEESNPEAEEAKEIFYLKKWIEKCKDKTLVVHLHDCSFTGD